MRTPPLEVLLDDTKIMDTHVEAVTGTVQDAGSFPAASTLLSPPPLKHIGGGGEMLNHVEVRCEYCKEPFKKSHGEYNRSEKLGRKHFCSMVCYGKHSGINNIPAEKTQDTKVTVNCSTCGKELQRKQSQLARSKNFFCDRKCKRQFEFIGLDREKRKSKVRRDHLKQKQALLDEFGIICQFPGCTLDLHNDRKMVDMHHFGDSLDHSKTKLLCPYHHRLADLGLLKI